MDQDDDFSRQIIIGWVLICYHLNEKVIQPMKEFKQLQKRRITMRLYDVEKHEYDELPQNESNFRSTKPYRCRICHAISNEYVFHRKYPGGVVLICPGRVANKHVHNLLGGKIKSLRPEHPASVIKELEEEIKTLRLQFQGVGPNVVGIENWNADDIPLLPDFDDED